VKSQEQVLEFEKVLGQMVGLLGQIAILSQKKPNDVLNKFKLDLVNELLRVANKCLGPDGKPFPEFELFDESAMPSNSDVAIMLAQYLSSLRSFREHNSRPNEDEDFDMCWVINGKTSNIKV
jgi:hypothetical protein